MRFRKLILSKSLCHLGYHDYENLCIEKIIQKTLCTSLRSPPLQQFKFYMYIVDLFWYLKFVWLVQRTMYGFKAQIWTVSSGAQQIWNYLKSQIRRYGFSAYLISNSVGWTYLVVNQSLKNFEISLFTVLFSVLQMLMSCYPHSC